MNEFNELKELINSMEEDMVKFHEKGNKAAGVRIRKSLQDIKNSAQAMRLGVSAKNKEV